ncbi:MAG: cysteine rich repeat-containing protein [Gammaproteobacteria bacterium]|jgi:hypothetical protein
MFKKTAVIIALGFFCVTGVQAQESVGEMVKSACQADLDKYCPQVTPGNQRLIACIYAHEDKISNRCTYALYDAAIALERAVAGLSYIAQQCEADIDRLCGDVVPGEGRILACLDDKKSDVSSFCKEAIGDVLGE